MNYLIYRLKFTSAVHFGKSMLSDSEYVLCSDTVFSALCMEAVKMGEDTLDKLISAVKSNELLISDALPYIGDKMLLPKPHLLVEHGLEENSSVIKKAYKKLKYITIDDFGSYLNGSFDVLNAVQMDELGVSALKVSASIRNENNETMPYEVGTFSFYDDCGLYLIAGFEGEESQKLFETLIDQLQHSGLGGKRSSGYGRFEYSESTPDEWLVERLNGDAENYMLLNTALPVESEIEDVLQGANYSLIKRGGFVASSEYSDSMQRKRELVMFKAGSCFSRRFSGDVFDVSTKAGSHPVYRYGKPMLMRIS